MNITTFNIIFLMYDKRLKVFATPGNIKIGGGSGFSSTLHVFEIISTRVEISFSHL